MTEVTEVDLPHLHRCVELATEAVEAGDFPFGSVLVAADGTVLAEDRAAVEHDISGGHARRERPDGLSGRLGEAGCCEIPARQHVSGREEMRQPVGEAGDGVPDVPDQRPHACPGSGQAAMLSNDGVGCYFKRPHAPGTRIPGRAVTTVPIVGSSARCATAGPAIVGAAGGAGSGGP
jgi:hypothetical protein